MIDIRLERNLFPRIRPCSIRFCVCVWLTAQESTHNVSYLWLSRDHWFNCWRFFEYIFLHHRSCGEQENTAISIVDTELSTILIVCIIFQAEADGSNEYNNYQPGSLNTTYQITRDLENIDIVFHIGDICYANGYLSQWDQFTAQVEPIASAVPYMIGRLVSYMKIVVCSFFWYKFFSYSPCFQW